MANKVTPETGDVRKKVFFKEHSSSLDEDNSFINDPHYIDKFDLDGKTIIKKDYSFSDEDDEQISPNVKINGRMVGHLRDSMSRFLIIIYSKFTTRRPSTNRPT